VTKPEPPAPSSKDAPVVKDATVGTEDPAKELRRINNLKGTNKVIAKDA